MSTTFQAYIDQHDLDISIVEKKNLGADKRIDSEYYKPEYLKQESLIQKGKYEKYGKLVKNIRCGPFGSTILCDTYLEDGVILARPFNLANMLFNQDDIVYISKEDVEEKGLKTFSRGDVLFARVGDIKSGIITDTTKEVTISPNIIASKSDQKKLNPYFAIIFFNTKYGENQLIRAQKVVAQPTISTQIVRDMIVPIPSTDFQKICENLLNHVISKKSLSKSLYAQAEQLLLDELGLSDRTPSEENIATHMSEDVKLFGRCDAEFFQPKYDELIEIVNNYKGGYGRLDELITISAETISREDYQKWKYIELSNIDTSAGLVQDFSVLQNDELPSRAKMKVQKGDVIVSSVAGSSNKIAIIQSEDLNMIASTGFFVLHSTVLLPEVMLVLMKSIYIQYLLQRSARGMILSATNTSDFASLPIPNLERDTQSQIQSLIIQSHQARNESKQLLETAQTAVEIFIEEDEDRAMEWISSQNK